MDSRKIGDTMQRTLHLAGIFGIDFTKEIYFDSKFISSASIDGKIARLHLITSEAWENYRHNRIEEFKDN